MKVKSKILVKQAQICSLDVAIFVHASKNVYNLTFLESTKNIFA